MLETSVSDPSVSVSVSLGGWPTSEVSKWVDLLSSLSNWSRSFKIISYGSADISKCAGTDSVEINFWSASICLTWRSLVKIFYKSYNDQLSFHFCIFPCRLSSKKVSSSDILVFLRLKKSASGKVILRYYYTFPLFSGNLFKRQVNCIG